MNTRDPLLQKVIARIESELFLRNEERRVDDLPLLKKSTIRLLGQFSLFADIKLPSVLPLAATMDLDALLEGDFSLRGIVVHCLKEFGLSYDDLSGEIWIPSESEFQEIFDSPILRVLALKPLYGLLCKAIKAPAKNRFLIREALKFYGKELEDLILKYQGDIEYFR